MVGGSHHLVKGCRLMKIENYWSRHSLTDRHRVASQCQVASARHRLPVPSFPYHQHPHVHSLQTQLQIDVPDLTEF